MFAPRLQIEAVENHVSVWRQVGGQVGEDASLVTAMVPGLLPAAAAAARREACCGLPMALRHASPLAHTNGTHHCHPHRVQMPEIVIVDEIGTEAEALACRTIAERGVQVGPAGHAVGH